MTNSKNQSPCLVTSWTVVPCQANGECHIEYFHLAVPSLNEMTRQDGSLGRLILWECPILVLRRGATSLRVSATLYTTPWLLRVLSARDLPGARASSSTSLVILMTDSWT